MIDLHSLSTDFYVNVNLNTELALPTARETVFAFFERIQKSYPSMRNFHTRESGELFLEEDKEQGHYRWVSIEPKRLCSGYVNPPQVEMALEQHRLVLELAPYMLSISPLDCEALDYLMGFDYTHRGNQNQLVANVLGASPAFDGLLSLPGAQALNVEPSIILALEESCKLQARISIETRTTASQIRRGEFAEEQISVYYTLRQYGALTPGVTYEETLAKLQEHSERLLENHVADSILRPLSQAVSSS